MTSINSGLSEAVLYLRGGKGRLSLPQHLSSLPCMRTKIIFTKKTKKSPGNFVIEINARISANAGKFVFEQTHVLCSVRAFAGSISDPKKNRGLEPLLKKHPGYDTEAKWMREYSPKFTWMDELLCFYC